MKRKWMLGGLLVLLVAMLSSCWTDVDPGYVGVRIWKRGTKAGQIEVLDVGRHDWAYAADDTFFPTYKQNYVWTKNPAEGSPNDESITFPIEGLTITIDVGIEFEVDKEKVGVIYSEYRQTLEGITDGAMRNYIRDAILSEAKVYNNMEKFITENEIATLIDAVEVNAQSYFAGKGITISQVYLVGAPEYPQSVVTSIEEKIKATQVAIQRENELREAEAAAKKNVAEAQGKADALLATATAEAEANRLLERSLTDGVLQKMWIDKWDGNLPEVMPGDSNLMMNLGN